MKTKQMMYTIL